MINRILLSVFLTLAALEGCNNPAKKEAISNPNECTQYACPMHPDKTSTFQAKCPECSMDMEVVVKQVGEDSTKKDTGKKEQ